MKISSDFPGWPLAAAFLRGMDPGTRTRGEKYFNDGRVSLADSTRLGEFAATVRGAEVYNVTLIFDASAGWRAVCTCPISFKCKHIYAAMKALIVESSAEKVRQLSASPPQVAPKKAKPRARKAAASLANDLEKKLDRPLTLGEANFFGKIRNAFLNCANGRKLSLWDCRELGIQTTGHMGQSIEIAPFALSDEKTFWLYVASACQELGWELPSLMLPITDINEIEEDLRQYRRKRDIKHWQKTLQNSEQWSSSGENVVREQCELRARFLEKSVVLEWRWSGLREFERLGITPAKQLRDDIHKGALRLSAEGQWLWETFESRLGYTMSSECPYTDTTTLARFRRMLLMSSFNAVLVNFHGQPFNRPEAPLRWSLQNAETEYDDYRLRVVQPDGSPVTDLICVIQGEPALFVTKDSLFQGPAGKGGIVTPISENVIPAPALETSSGAALLHSLGIELPPRLRERTRIVPLRTIVSCKLEEKEAGSSIEMCHIAVRAESEDATEMQHWTGAWTRVNNPQPNTKADKSRIITVFDRTGLRDPRALLLGLESKWDAYRDSWSLRVTKKFPDLFSNWLKSLPPEVKVELHGEMATFSAEAISGTVQLEATESDIDWFDLKVVLNVSDATLTQQEINLLLDARGGYVRLEGKGWRKLQFNMTPEEDEKLARLGLTARELSSEPQRMHALQLADAAARNFLPEEQFEKIERRAAEIKTRVTPDQPASISATMRPYQTEGFHFLAYLAENRFGGILADDMGLGKTLQTLTWLVWLRDSKLSSNPEGKIPPILVVCPKSVMDNWSAETKRFAPGLRVKVWSAGEVNQIVTRLTEADVHVMNYNQLRLIGESLAPVRWLAVILDEGQYIKNPASQTAMVARALRAEHRLVLSGTPIENRLLDLWSLMTFAMPGILGSRSQFATLYDSKDDPFARRRLSARVRPFLLRRTKAQVAKDLPDRIEEDLFCEIEGEQKALYRAELKRAQQILLGITTQKQLAKERFSFLTSLLRLRQICCDPKLIKPDSKAASAKVESLFDQLEPLMEEGHKVLVFSQFVEMLDILRVEIQKREWPSFYLSGATENRGDLVQRFQESEGAAVFLISLKAGGFGLNLTAASYVVLFDPWWNPAVENQAIDRTHRIGQTRNVIAYRLLIKDSIEEKIRLLQKTKSALAEDVLGEEKFAQSLTLDDLHFLLSE